MVGGEGGNKVSDPDLAASSAALTSDAMALAGIPDHRAAATGDLLANAAPRKTGRALIAVQDAAAIRQIADISAEICETMLLQ